MHNKLVLEPKMKISERAKENRANKRITKVVLVESELLSHEDMIQKACVMERWKIDLMKFGTR